MLHAEWPPRINVADMTDVLLPRLSIIKPRGGGKSTAVQ